MMNYDKNNLIKSLMESLSHLDYIKTADIPGIDLYMDQVTTFMDEHLNDSKRYRQDKVLTKTMINNYAKNHLLPPPVKKKYSKEHLLVLIFIYYFKGFLSFADIQTILNPLTEHFFQSDTEFNMERIYNEIFQMGKEELELIKEDTKRMCETAAESFENAPTDDQEFLHFFSMICLLSFDVYMKKQMIEKLIDEYQKKKEENN